MMNIIDNKIDFYDHFGNESDDIVYDRKDSISLVRDYPDIFSPTSNRLGTIRSSASTLIVVFSGGLRKSFVRSWKKSKNGAVISEIHLTLSNLEDFDLERASLSMALRYILGTQTTEESPLIVCALNDIKPDFRVEDFIKRTLVIKNPIIFGSVLEYVLSAKEIYDSIENYLLDE